MVGLPFRDISPTAYAQRFFCTESIGRALRILPCHFAGPVGLSLGRSGDEETSGAIRSLGIFRWVPSHGRVEHLKRQTTDMALFLFLLFFSSPNLDFPKRSELATLLGV